MRAVLAAHLAFAYASSPRDDVHALDAAAMGRPFAPAQALYRRAGFRECEPFGDYRRSRSSVCMTLPLDHDA